ncbi:FecR domain-containing protein [Achromobacter deleyi]|uniref:FecR domain-containing protein n=1 Tax=Achromobacter deleyi TaxID=1353891 RepID=UPI001492167F|nr:FecR domain-containing protein [Achromobacter deleyi]QVQ24147.1 FecR domain-containing protein [Achromobacter deleyi]UIP19678.1 FecR domain-containing protein [Achromobacter deleyi]
MPDAADGMPPDPVVRQAIVWWAKLQSGLADTHDRESCSAWLAQDPAHRQAWDRLQAIGRDARRVPAALAHAALNAPASQGRRAALRGLLAVAGVAATGWTGYRHAPWQRLVADFSTSVGERRSVALADGLRITLNSDTAVRVNLSGNARGIDLLRGEMLVQAEPRPGVEALRVDTGYGELRAERARFDLRRTGSGSRVGVYEGSVALLRDGVLTHVNAGERLVYADQGEVSRNASDPDRLAWVDGMVVAKDWRLADFAEYLARQRVGVIRVDPAVAELRLSGVFPLDDAERALRALEPALPIAVTRHTQYWLQVGPREI